MRCVAALFLASVRSGLKKHIWKYIGSVAFRFFLRRFENFCTFRRNFNFSQNYAKAMEEPATLLCACMFCKSLLILPYSLLPSKVWVGGFLACLFLFFFILSNINCINLWDESFNQKSKIETFISQTYAFTEVIWTSRFGRKKLWPQLGAFHDILISF